MAIMFRQGGRNIFQYSNIKWVTPTEDLQHYNYYIRFEVCTVRGMCCKYSTTVLYLRSVQYLPSTGHLMSFGVMD